MNRRRENNLRIGAICAAVLMIIPSANADVRMPTIFGDHMVLQQGIDLPFWGQADAGENVTVSAAGRSATTTAGADGKWKLKLSRLDDATAPIEVTVRGKNTLVFHDVLVGGVWVCSGQSNMEFILTHAHNAATEIPNANHPTIRLFSVPLVGAVEPQWDCEGKWVVCTPETAAAFSAVGYFFGKHLSEKLNVPIGLIHASWGGTSAQVWTSLPTLEKFPEFQEFVQSYNQVKKNAPQIRAKFEADVAVWREANSKWQQQWKEAATAPADIKEKLRKSAPREPKDPTKGVAPCFQFNGMIAPVIPFAIQGVIWYQGEANVGSFAQYRTLFPAMITDWRQNWGQGDFPFLFVQLANFIGRKDKPDGGNWAALREAQTMALALPKTGMAVAIDIGQANDVHPRNKLDVGLRLAKAAMHVAYGQEGEYSGPMLKDWKVEGSRARLSFTHTGSGLTIGSAPSPQPSGLPEQPANALRGFAIAGTDRQFVLAEAKIEGDSVLVSSGQVSAPAAVRYGWADNPEVNLYNKEGLPASPFRTDDWDPKETSVLANSPPN